MPEPTERLPYFPDDWQKWTDLQAATEADSRDPAVRELARRLELAADSDERRFVLLCHCVARDWIGYASDLKRTGGEDIAGVTRPPRAGDATEALSRGHDDCDAKARLFVALCLARGCIAELAPLWRPSGGHLRLAHVFARVVLDGKPHDVETILARARLGDHPYSVPFEKGKKQWRYS